MAPDVQAVVNKIAARYSSSDAALNQCSIACRQVIAELEAIGITDVQHIEVFKPCGSTRPHPQLSTAHSVLRIGTEAVDVTWMQIDPQAEHPYKLYPTMDALRGDWTVVRDWATSADL